MTDEDSGYEKNTVRENLSYVFFNAFIWGRADLWLCESSFHHGGRHLPGQNESDKIDLWMDVAYRVVFYDRARQGKSLRVFAPFLFCAADDTDHRYLCTKRRKYGILYGDLYIGTDL